MVRYIDDFVVCFQYREDALRFQDALRNGWEVRPHAGTDQDQARRIWPVRARHAGKHGRKRPETIYFLGFTLYCTRNLKGNFKVGMRTEKSRLRRSLMSLQEKMRQIRHLPVREQVDDLNDALRGHYAYYGIAGNFRALQKVHRHVERYWRKMLCSRSWAARRLTWPTSISSRSGSRSCDQSCGCPIGRCKLSQCCEPTPEERSAGNPHATFCGVLWTTPTTR